MKTLLEKTLKNKTRTIQYLPFRNYRLSFLASFNRSTTLFSNKGLKNNQCESNFLIPEFNLPNQRFESTTCPKLKIWEREKGKTKKDLKNTNYALFQTKVGKQLKWSTTNIGNTLNLTINAIGYKNIGIAELSNGSTIFIPNLSQYKLGLEDKIKAKIIKVNATKPKFAIAKLQEIIQKSKKEVPVKVGEILEFTLTALGPKGSGKVQLPGGYTLFIPNTKSSVPFKKSQIVKAQITRIKAKYAFAKIVKSDILQKTESVETSENISLKSKKRALSLIFNSSNKIKGSTKVSNNLTLQVGTKFQAFLPKTAFSISNSSGNYIITKLNGLILFLKMSLGSKLGDKVQIQFTKIEKNFGIGKVIKISPLSRAKKNKNTKYAIKHMLKNGMHFGEKAIKCHANMKKYVWLRKKSISNSFSAISTTFSQTKDLVSKANQGLPTIPFGKGEENWETLQGWGNGLKTNLSNSSQITSLKQAENNQFPNFSMNPDNISNKAELSGLLRFPSEASPKGDGKQSSSLAGSEVANQIEDLNQRLMKDKATDSSENSFKSKKSQEISELLAEKKQKKEFQKQNRPLIKKGRYLLNLLKTRRCLLQSLKQLSKYAAKGRTFLFVGTKKPATGLMSRAALLTKNSFFVNTRWLGGMLTNWKTILKSISKIKPILKEKQKMIKNILEKRQNIKKQLIQKVNRLRKKSRQLIQKGQSLILKVKTEKPKLIEISHILIKKRASFIEKSEILLEKYKQLDSKKRQLNDKKIQLQQKGDQIFSRKKILVSQLSISIKKLQELKLLLLLSDELKNLQNETINQGNDLWSISYSQFSKFVTNDNLALVPNPPKPILNKIIHLIRQKSDSRLFANLSSNLPFPKSSIWDTSFPFTNRNIFSTSLKPCIPCFDPLPLRGIDLYSGKGEANPKEEEINQELRNRQFEKEKDISYNTIVRSISSDMPQKTEKILLISKLLTKLSRFVPFIKTYKEILTLRIQNIQILLTQLQTTVDVFQTKASFILNLRKQINSELSLVKEKLVSEKKFLKTLKNKFKKLASEQRLLDFLPKLRYLPTPKNKMAETIQILMKKFVDPKMRYPIDKIYDEKLKFHSKKIAATRKKKWQRLEKYFGGVTKMAKMKKKQISKNIAIIVGQKEEMNAIYECKKLGIKMFHIVDTNCNPRLADYLVPSNDDSRNSIKFVLGKILIHLKLAEKLRKKFSKLS